MTGSSQSHVLLGSSTTSWTSSVRDELEPNAASTTGATPSHPSCSSSISSSRHTTPCPTLTLSSGAGCDMSFKYITQAAPEDDDVIHSRRSPKFRKLRLADEKHPRPPLKRSLPSPIEKASSKRASSSTPPPTPKRAITSARTKRSATMQSSSEDRLTDVSTEEKNACRETESGILEDQILPAKNSSRIRKDEAHRLPSPPSKKTFPQGSRKDKPRAPRRIQGRTRALGTKTADGHPSSATDPHIATRQTSDHHRCRRHEMRKGDGQQLKALVEKTRKAVLEVRTIVSGTAYSGKQNRTRRERQSRKHSASSQSSIPSSRTPGKRKARIASPTTKMLPCGARPAPHSNQKGAYRQKEPGQEQVMTYYFDVERCHACP